jgi:surface protein
MDGMFFEAISFNQDISQWDVKNVNYRDDIFFDCPIEEEYKPKFN